MAGGVQLYPSAKITGLESLLGNFLVPVVRTLRPYCQRRGWGTKILQAMRCGPKIKKHAITSVVSHSYLLEWHTSWLCWDWTNGCPLHEVFPLPPGLVGEIKCMHWIKSISNCGLTLTHTNTYAHTYLNQTFRGAILALCVMHSGIFYSISTEKQYRSYPTTFVSQNTHEFPPRVWKTLFLGFGNGWKTEMRKRRWHDTFLHYYHKNNVLIYYLPGCRQF